MTIPKRVREEAAELLNMAASNGISAREAAYHVETSHALRIAWAALDAVPQTRVQRFNTDYAEAEALLRTGEFP
jgi:hypothetical protein